MRHFMCLLAKTKLDILEEIVGGKRLFILLSQLFCNRCKVCPNILLFVQMIEKLLTFVVPYGLVLIVLFFV